MTQNELMQKYGYKDVATAQHAMMDAGVWMHKHRGKKAPIHIRKALEFAAEMEREAAAERDRMSAIIRRHSRSPRFWFGVVLKGTRFVRFRHWARAKFNLYFTPEQAEAHFRLMVPADFEKFFAQSTPENRIKAIDSLADSIVRLYGFTERSNPGSYVKDAKEERFAPWEVGKRIAWRITADILKGRFPD